MKVTFMEEIEAHRAWTEGMYCKVCDHGTYRIHHQLQPEEWWVECDNCHYESKSAITREAAIKNWRKGL